MTDHRASLADMMKRAPDQIDLARAALLIARERYPELDPQPYIAQLDTMAGAIQDTLPSKAGAWATLRAINTHLFDELGFHGNEADYYDPRNSFLNDVIDRRTGIPITLSIVYMEVARRLGIELKGVGMPRHFLLKYPGREGDVVIDPFSGGAALTTTDIAEKIEAAGGTRDQASQYLASVTPRQIITRVLRNLKETYVSARSFDEALGIIELMLCVNPWDLDEIRDRGQIQYQRHAYAEALNDLETYLRYRSEAADAGEIWESVQTLRPRVRDQQ